MSTSTRGKDWHSWHDPYDHAGSSLSVRLALVQSHLRKALDAAPAGEIRVVSLCAGQGRDLVGVLERHPRAADVRARLVELDADNVAYARRSIDELGRGEQIEVLEDDASLTDSYTGFTPAQIVICCGVFGNLSDDDVQRLIWALPGFCDRGALVVWTRHLRPPDLTVAMRAWFKIAGFEEVAFTAPSHLAFVGVGAARWPGTPGVLNAGQRLFEWLEDPLPPT